MQQNILTAFHLQTDGFTERTNQWVEQYLQLVTSNRTHDWSDWLPIASLIHNNAQNSTIRTTPNQALIGYDLIPSYDHMVPQNNEEASRRVQTLREFQKMAVTAINQKATPAQSLSTQWKKGQKVWLEAKNLNLPHGTIKLAPRHHGPFEIV